MMGMQIWHFCSKLVKLVQAHTSSKVTWKSKSSWNRGSRTRLSGSRSNNLSEIWLELVEKLVFDEGGVEGESENQTGPVISVIFHPDENVPVEFETLLEVDLNGLIQFL